MKAALASALAALLLGGCISVGLGGDAAAHRHLVLADATVADVARRDAPLVEALLLQPQPADAMADTLSIAYARAEGSYAFYQHATWTERPVRQLPRLLQQRLEKRGIAVAVGSVGDPLRADWLLAIGVDTVHHDVRTPPGTARLALTVDLFDRRQRVRVAHRRFMASAPVAQADSAAAAAALSVAVGATFDALMPWLEAELQRAAAR